MLRRIHLTSGLILFVFVASHFLNHSLGLVCLEAMEAGQDAFLFLWRNPLGTLLLYGAFAFHIVLAGRAIFRRRILRFNSIEWAQLLLGLAIPLLLISHVIHTRFAHEVFGIADTYQSRLYIYFIVNPTLIYQQMTLALIAWGHGVLGVRQWLKLKPLYRRYETHALLACLALPALAFAGLWTAGRDVHYLSKDENWVNAVTGQTDAPALAGDETTPQPPLDLAFLADVESWVLTVFLVLVALVFALRPLRHKLHNRLGLVQLTYPGSGQIIVARGTSVLEASRQNNIPHASVCGGRGRCSTCRIRVSDFSGALAHPDPMEAEVLGRIGADRNVRLACQFRPSSDCRIEPLLPAATTTHHNVGTDTLTYQGQERDIVVLFADIRGFTALSEGKLPFDVVFLLNRYFASMGPAIENAGGHVDKFIGDGVMALFGVKTDYQTACRQALQAVETISTQLSELNDSLRLEVEQPLRLAIGLHGGSAIIGRMGHGAATGLTAVGDTVNTASRLESEAKSANVQLVISETVIQGAGVALETQERHEIRVRGKKELLNVYLVPEITGALV